MARRRNIGPQAEPLPPVRPAVADAECHAAYRSMIAAEIGLPNYREKGIADDGRPLGLLALLVNPLALFLISLLLLGAVTMMTLWRAGMFGELAVRHNPIVKEHATRHAPAMVPPVPEYVFANDTAFVPAPLDKPAGVVRTDPAIDAGDDNIDAASEAAK